MPVAALGIDLQSGILIAAILLIAQQLLKSTTDWTVKQGLALGKNFLASETTNREEKSGNERAVQLQNDLRERVEKQREELDDKADRISDYEWMIRSLRKQNISKQRIIQEYWRPLPAIIITFFNDYEDGDEDEKFLKKYLVENNEAEALTALTYVVPPKGFPERFANPSEVGREKIREWIETDILTDYPTGRVAICQASVVDLRRVYSRTDYERHGFNRKTIGEALDIESILDRHDVHRILAQDNVNLSKAIENGDVAFFLSRYLSEDELSDIHEFQDQIEDDLGNPSLRQIAQTEFVTDLASAIAPYVDNPREPATKAVEEAKLWHTELQT